MARSEAEILLKMFNYTAITKTINYMVMYIHDSRPTYKSVQKSNMVLLKVISVFR